MSKVSQVVARRTVTFVVPSECIPEDHVGAAEEIYALSEAKGSGVVYEDCEVLAVEPADWVCTGCLADLEIRGDISGVRIRLAGNGTRPTISYEDLSSATIECSQDCGNVIPTEEQEEKLKSLT